MENKTPVSLIPLPEVDGDRVFGPPRRRGASGSRGAYGE